MRVEAYTVAFSFLRFPRRVKKIMVCRMCEVPVMFVRIYTERELAPRER